MRLVELKDISYDRFEQIRDNIYAKIPFALVNQGYSPKLRLGIFNFWDSDYISAELQPYIVKPPPRKEEKE